MKNIVKASDRVGVVRCHSCVYFNDMRDLGKGCFCDLHSVKDTEGDIAHFFDVDPNAYCAWGYSLGSGTSWCGMMPGREG